MPLLLVLLAIAVSIWWLIASNMAAKEFDRIRSAEATRGRLWSCGEIAMGGFPFRIEAECRQAKLMVLGDHPTTITANRYVVVSQIYQPSLLLLEIDAPLSVTGANGSATTVNWSLFRASVHLESSLEADRISLEANDVIMKPSAQNEAAQFAHFEAHFRKRPVETGSSSDIEFSVDLSKALLASLGGAAFDGHVSGRVDQGVVFLEQMGPPALENWRKAEGKLVIDQLTMKRGDQHLSVSGVVTLDEQRRPSGKVDLAATGLRDLLKQTDMGQLADMMAGDVRLPLTMTKGRLLMGPLKLADLQPLY